MISNSRNYIDFLNSWISAQPKNGRGVSKRMADYTGVSTVLMSQILGGSRLLTEEHAFKVARFCNLNSLETDLFIHMVQLERAGSAEYKVHIKEKISQLRDQIQKAEFRVKPEKVLEGGSQMEFYSHWKYSFIRLALALPKEISIQDISSVLQIPPNEVQAALNFLLKENLLIKHGTGYNLGSRSTHLNKSSPLFYSRQTQLRNLGIAFLAKQQNSDIFFSAPFTASCEDIEWLRSKILQLIEELSLKVKNTDAEKLCCVNFDLFEVI